MEADWEEHLTLDKINKHSLKKIALYIRFSREDEEREKRTGEDTLVGQLCTWKSNYRYAYGYRKLTVLLSREYSLVINKKKFHQSFL